MMLATILPAPFIVVNMLYLVDIRLIQRSESLVRLQDSFGRKYPSENSATCVIYFDKR